MTVQVASPAAGSGPARFTPWLVVVLAVVIGAGGLFGYDQGVISGALPGIKTSFDLSTFMLQVVTSWVTLGALVGSLAGGAMGDGMGRKRTILLAAAFFTLGAAIQWLAPGAAILVVGRFIVGFGVGVAAVAAPLYASELAPAGPARPVHLQLSAGDHHRHLPRLSGQRRAVVRHRLAADAGRGRGSGAARCSWWRCCLRNRRAG